MHPLRARYNLYRESRQPALHHDLRSSSLLSAVRSTVQKLTGRDRMALSCHSQSRRVGGCHARLNKGAKASIRMNSRAIWFCSKVSPLTQVKSTSGNVPQKKNVAHLSFGKAGLQRGTGKSTWVPCLPAQSWIRYCSLKHLILPFRALFYGASEGGWGFRCRLKTALSAGRDVVLPPFFTLVTLFFSCPKSKHQKQQIIPRGWLFQFTKTEILVRLGFRPNHRVALFLVRSRLVFFLRPFSGLSERPDSAGSPGLSPKESLLSQGLSAFANRPSHHRQPSPVANGAFRKPHLSERKLLYQVSSFSPFRLLKPTTGWQTPKIRGSAAYLPPQAKDFVALLSPEHFASSAVGCVIRAGSSVPQPENPSTWDLASPAKPKLLAVLSSTPWFSFLFPTFLPSLTPHFHPNPVTQSFPMHLTYVTCK
ncbi:hypothetical protein VTK73DRAFT_9054 [Phialemonium thermophilum]|uniref:Uncharacterized protein n=1 Tax=Phialemonium thermophilum TaxID=223376 RepID=A0ABR3W5K1_9PEZI